MSRLPGISQESAGEPSQYDHWLNSNGRWVTRQTDDLEPADETCHSASMLSPAGVHPFTGGDSRATESGRSLETRLRFLSRMIRAGVVVSFLVVAGCASHEGSPRPNVILISLDTLRADHLGCYGYPRSTTPAIDAFAAGGTVFERTVANAPWTLPSHASILTGLQPRHHGVRSHETALPEFIPTLATVLAASGYQTMAIVNSKQLLARYGLHRGFRQFEYFPERIDKRRVRSGLDQVDLAMEWISQVRGRPFFLFLHNYDVHSDYDPSPRFTGEFVHPYAGLIRGTTGDLMRVRRGEVELTPGDIQHLVDLYDAGLREVDADICSLYDYRIDTGLAKSTILILTSDHGEEFLEHGGVLHGRTMYRELLDVPLIIGGPGVPEGRRVGQLVQPSDIFSTVLELVGLQSVQTRDGESLVAAWTEKSNRFSERRVFAEADHNREAGDDTLVMVQTDRYKLVFERNSETSWLYDCKDDPLERRDIASQYPDVVKTLLEELLRLDEDRRSGEPISPPTGAEREALRSLGYLQ